MSFLDLVKRRKSIRKYDTRPVPREAIERCLEAARLAPSACNCQPWQFIVVDDAQLKERVAQAAFSGVHTMNSFAKNAPVLVAVVRDRSSYLSALGGACRGIPFSLIDVGIACEHFALQAAEEGIGTCYLGWFKERAVKNILGLTRDKKIDMMMSMGYPAGDEQRDKIRKSLNEMSRFNLENRFSH